MTFISHFIGGTGVGIVDVCVAAADQVLKDDAVGAADLLEAGWALYRSPGTLDTSRLVEKVGDWAFVISALMLEASTTTWSMQIMRDAMVDQVEGG